MPKVVIYDFDRGLRSLGTDDRIEQVFGFKPRRFIKSESLWEFFDKTHKLEILQTEDELGICEQEYYITTKDFDFEVLDSLTAYSVQKKSELKADAPRLSLPKYGELGEDIEDLVIKLTRSNSNFICIGHTKPTEDSDLGIVTYQPLLSGRMKDEISRHFDIVAYTLVETDREKGTRSYYWQIVADERRSAKCRISEVSNYAMKNGGKIPQDFALLWNLLTDKRGIKMLILGESGTGKTYSLRSLKDVSL